jgi:23S rRNA (adenine2503-C2)-methyltransferase
MNLLDMAPFDAHRTVSAWVAGRSDEPYRVGQIVPRLWQRPIRNWSEATDLPRVLVDALETWAPLPHLTPCARETSRDGTVKFLWTLADGLAIESVWIPEGKRRRTLCISSQAGCAFGCRFCATGRMGFQRHLDSWEITGQVREMLLDTEFGRPTNVVFMGMGEPLHNWSAVDVALTTLNDALGFGIGARHITVTTVGLLPQLAKLARRSEQFRLAISLHAATSQRRAALMPVERKYNLERLVVALRDFARRVTLEYVMIEGANDSPEDATSLAQMAKPLGAMVNLLPLHPGGAGELVPSPPEAMQAFASRLRAHGVNVTVRRSRGVDIRAACGQLRVETAVGSGVPPKHDGDV